MTSEDQAKCLCCRRSTGRTFFLVIFMILYLLIGAIVFSLIESPGEKRTVQQLKNHRQDFMLSHNNCMTEEELENFIVHVVRSAERGISAIGNVSSEPNWSFGQSVFFAATVLTTIGYGHSTPLSEEGKVFCIFYAIIGIPLTLVLFTAIVERLMIPSTRMLQYLFAKQRSASPFAIRLVHMFGVVLINVVFVFLIPAAVFSSIEPQWSYLDSLYYCFISMSTIGLGDYIPGESSQQKHRALYKTFITIYLYCGLIFMMFTLAVIYEIPELNLGMHFYMESDAKDGEKQRLRDSDATETKYTTDDTSEKTDQT